MSGRATSFFRSRVIEERLGAYVYALVHPLTGKAFYIGKAGGRDGRGNTRPDSHLAATATAQAEGRTLSPVEEIIAGLWKENLDPQLAIVRRLGDQTFGPAEAALEVEAALIDVLQILYGGAEGNAISGQQTARGLLIGAEIEFAVAAPPVDPTVPIADAWLFNIANNLAGARNPPMDRLYQAVRGDWSIGLPPRPGFAVGLISGISRIVCRVDRWYVVEDVTGKRRRKRFDGEPFGPEEPIAAELLHRDFGRIIEACPSWNRGQPVRIDFDGRGQAQPTYNGRRDVSVSLGAPSPGF